MSELPVATDRLRRASETAETDAIGIAAEKKATDIAPDTAVYNGIPHLKEGAVFAGKFKIHERVGWDNAVGASYYAMPLNAMKELVLRIDADDTARKHVPSCLFAETAVLKLAENTRKYVLFTQIYSYDLTARHPWLAVYNRGGPTVKECLDFVAVGKFTHGTTGRFAADIIEIIDFLHNHDFLATHLDFNMLRFDPCSRTVFLADLGYVKVDPSKRHLRQKQPVQWRGNAAYAPLSYHGSVDLTQWDELESVYYLIHEMVTGALPWENTPLSELETRKLLFIQEDNFAELPEQYLKLYESILRLKADQSGDYSKIKELAVEIYTEVGGVTDPDQNLDFEVDFPDIPDEELPRFIMEKKPIEGEDGEVKEEIKTEEKNEETKEIEA
uniref:Protein kinase domain-containing protein n=1 Tax=Panagrellus redivivus TaxID=6233 RepID=A0A7E4WB83_PANRE